MKIQPVLETAPTGEPIVPIGAADLAPMAKDASLTALRGDVQALHADLAALRGDVQAQPLPSTKAVQVTLDLTAPLADSAVNLKGIALVQAVTVRTLTGTLGLKLGNAAADLLAVAQGETRDRLSITGILATSPGGGGTAVLEIHGR